MTTIVASPATEAPAPDQPYPGIEPFRITGVAVCRILPS